MRDHHHLQLLRGAAIAKPSLCVAGMTHVAMGLAMQTHRAAFVPSTSSSHRYTMYTYNAIMTRLLLL